jgi:hypothetical protein
MLRASRAGLEIRRAGPTKCWQVQKRRVGSFLCRGGGPRTVRSQKHGTIGRLSKENLSALSISVFVGVRTRKTKAIVECANYYLRRQASRKNQRYLGSTIVKGHREEPD